MYKNAVIIYSLPCHSKPVWLTFFCGKQKMFWKKKKKKKSLLYFVHTMEVTGVKCCFGSHF